MPRKSAMLSGTPGAVKATRALGAILCCVVVASGCFWRHYAARMTMHAELLVATAHKARDLVESGRFTAEGLPELTYPLERATAFAADVRRRASDPLRSLAAFDELVARYRAYVDAVDQVRRVARGAQAGLALGDPLAAVDAAARGVQTALAAERDG